MGFHVGKYTIRPMDAMGCQHLGQQRDSRPGHCGERRGGLRRQQHVTPEGGMRIAAIQGGPPTSYKYGYNSSYRGYNPSYPFIRPLIGVTTPFITSRGPSC